MDIVWEEPPPAVLRAQGKAGKYMAFAEELRDHVGKWALLPEQEGETRTEKGSKGTAQNIRRGAVKGFGKGEFEAVADGGKVYVRFVGPAEPGDEADTEEQAKERDVRRQAAAKAAEDADFARTVRSWAKVKGIPVEDRGRLPGKLIRDYCKETGTPLPNGMAVVS